MSTTTHKGKRRVGLPIIATAGLASVSLAFSLTPTFSGIVASITNDNNTAGAGYLEMTETGTQTNATAGAGDGTGTATCVSSQDPNNTYATCSSINKYGNKWNMTPGQSVTEKVTITNTGGIAATAFTLAAAACTDARQPLTPAAIGGATGTLCDDIQVKIGTTSGGAEIMTAKTLTAFAAAAPLTLTPLAASASADYFFTVTWVSAGTTADTNNQGHYASQALTWTFNA